MYQPRRQVMDGWMDNTYTETNTATFLLMLAIYLITIVEMALM